jgi:hypothetical protein
VLPRLLRSPGQPLVPAPAGPPVGLHEAAKPRPVLMALAPLEPDGFQAAAVAFGGGFQATGGLAVQGAPAVAGGNFLMLD